MSWEINEFNPYARLIPSNKDMIGLGSVIDEENYIKVLLSLKGISEEMYPQEAVEEVIEICDNFDSKLRKANRLDLRDELVLTID